MTELVSDVDSRQSQGSGAGGVELATAKRVIKVVLRHLCRDFLKHFIIVLQMSDSCGRG